MRWRVPGGRWFRWLRCADVAVLALEDVVNGCSQDFSDFGSFDLVSSTVVVGVQEEL